ncbi:MAG: haloalkane dehalogenase [Gammaproteobacteria bacterium]|nr:haloalkane dehalogenase [Gammaproteobacteria bacterium]|tara:strand:+ start:135 stop:1022 length:888 start_codon:yes stop_codon:yes gene_type:complete
MKVLKTPEERFQNLKDFNFKENFFDVTHENQKIRMHYLDENSDSDEVVLLLHGEPTWCYLYRHIIPILTKAGKRVIAPDLIGFGKSDKLAEKSNYSYANHIDWVTQLFNHLVLNNVILFAQDWGGLIGLRLLTASPEKFSGLVASNTGLPIGKGSNEGFQQWLNFSQTVEDFNSGKIVYQGSLKQIDEEEIAAYNAPFPDETYKAAARVFPLLVPITEEHDQVQENIAAWEVLKEFKKPTIAIFGEHDFSFKGQDKFFIEKIPGAKGMNHQQIDAGHFSQENQPNLIAETILSIT